MKVVPYNAEAHERFVYGSWLQSYADTPHVAFTPRMTCIACGERSEVPGLPPDLYYAYQRAIIADLIGRAVTIVLEDDGLLMGFVVGERVGPERIALHYVFVKPRDREEGLGGELIEALLTRLNRTSADTVSVTHEQPPFWTFTRRMGWRYEPRWLSARNHEEMT